MNIYYNRRLALYGVPRKGNAPCNGIVAYRAQGIQKYTLPFEIVDNSFDWELVEFKLYTSTGVVNDPWQSVYHINKSITGNFIVSDKSAILTVGYPEKDLFKDSTSAYNAIKQRNLKISLAQFNVIIESLKKDYSDKHSLDIFEKILKDAEQCAEGNVSS